MTVPCVSHLHGAAKHPVPQQGVAGRIVLPYATPADLACGGSLRQGLADFVVEEVPAYTPSGSGEHLYVLVEKRGLSTPDLISRARRVFGLAPRQVGHAGLKDAHAVTRQWLSFHSEAPLPVERLEGPDITVLAATRHTNKLRPGHLRANRFRIVIRDAQVPAAFTDLLATLCREGFPNYFGPQRFGHDGRNARLGRQMVAGPSRPRASTDRLRFFTNAYQAALFNALVAHRLTALGDLARLLPGDLAVRHDSGGFFSVRPDELEAVQERARTGEVSASAPLFGHKVPLAEGAPGEWEQATLQREGLTPDAFRLGSKRLSARGERRPVRAFPQELAAGAVADDPAAVAVTFALPPGTYATSLLRELMKNDDLCDVRHGAA